MSKQFQWVKKHKKNCSGLRLYKAREWDTPWAYVTDEVTWGTRVARRRKGGHIRWRTVLCNGMDCGALLAFREEVFFNYLPTEPKKKTT